MNTTPMRSDNPRGLYEEEIAPPGERWFKVVMSSGKVGIVHLPAELVDQSLVDGLAERIATLDAPAPESDADVAYPRLSLVAEGQP